MQKEWRVRNKLDVFHQFMRWTVNREWQWAALLMEMWHKHSAAREKIQALNIIILPNRHIYQNTQSPKLIYRLHYISDRNFSNFCIHLVSESSLHRQQSIFNKDIDVLPNHSGEKYNFRMFVDQNARRHNCE